ncbi:hypothetical protein GVAV_000536 [Gurleya vavrai]
MSKNIFKQLEQQIQSQNKKLMENIKQEMELTFKSKENDLKLFYSHKDKKIKKAYAAFMQKIEIFQERQNDDFKELKSMIENINELFTKQNEKNNRMHKKLEDIKGDLKKELKKEMEDIEKKKRKVHSEIDFVKKNLIVNLVICKTVTT